MLPTAMGTALPNLQPQTLFSKHLLPVLKGSSRENLPELERVSSLVHSLCDQFLEAPRGPHTTLWWLCSQFLEAPRGPTPHHDGCVPAYFTRGNWSFTCSWADAFQATAILLLAGLQ